MTTRTGNVAGAVPLILWIVLIGTATLRTSGGPQVEGGLCLICGERGTADALLNLLLFAPLGFLMMRRYGGWAGFLVPALLSLGIEGLQQAIPGRNPSVGDILFNGVGGAIGAAVGGFGPWLGRGRIARIGLVGAVALAAAALALTAGLSAPEPPRTTYYGQWTPDLGHYDRYFGRVLDAQVAGVRVPGERLERWAPIRAALAAGTTVRVHAVAGPPPADLAPLFSIYDERQQEAFLLGIDGDDVVVQYRTRAAAWRFDHYRHRASGLAGGIEAGEPMRIVVSTGPGGLEISLNGRRVHLAEPKLARGWELLFGAVPPNARPFLDVLWLTLLFAPVGLLAPGRTALLISGAALATPLVALPAFFPLPPTPASAVAIATVALLGGAVARMGVLRLFDADRPPRLAGR